jgi:hypothetical protein
MRLFLVAMAFAIAATPVVAQGRHGGKKQAAQPQQSEEKKKAAQQLDKDYNAAMARIPDKTFDPWGSVRPAQNSK